MVDFDQSQKIYLREIFYSKKIHICIIKAYMALKRNSSEHKKILQKKICKYNVDEKNYYHLS